ncbi:MAG TPA: helicase-related protein, partial [bacterium]|nr:helicase-related protein [bacterium]
LKLGLLHGKMSSAEKQAVMADFKKKATDILVSTTVIEVGVNVPNATIMVIEHAERFGLTQMHQLRGRVGRGADQSYCILMVGKHHLMEETEQRLRIMEETTDGFKIAEEDLRLRGPGEFFGTKQSGMPELRLANIVEDRELMALAKEAAFTIVNLDPQLRSATHKTVRKKFLEAYRDRMDLSQIG